MAAISDKHFSALQFLLKAPSKDAVRLLCADSFPAGAPESRRLAESTAGNLSVSAIEAKELICALHNLSHHILFHNLNVPEQILALFPESFHSSLKNLITKIMLEHSPTWRNEVLSNQISLPQLVEMDWRVDMKTASDSVSRMAVPTCLVNMKVCHCGGLQLSRGQWCCLVSHGGVEQGDSGHHVGWPGSNP
uniref:COMM domain containing 9 n=1 Tax=Esox lucius TaxID=8010 RepID=A0A3P9ALZ5_ESOLU